MMEAALMTNKKYINLLKNKIYKNSSNNLKIVLNSYK